MTTNEQPILKRLVRQKGELVMLMHYACVATFDELATLAKKNLARGWEAMERNNKCIIQFSTIK